MEQYNYNSGFPDHQLTWPLGFQSNATTTDNEEKPEQIKVSFLFGAGASKAAGVPTTYEFVKEFNKEIEKDKDKVINKANGIIQDKIKTRLSGKHIDVEVLLRTINEIINFDYFDKTAINAFIDKEEIYKVFNSIRPDKSYGSHDLKILYKKLLNFIRAKVIIPKEQVSEKIKYLNPLRAFLGSMPLDIYSVNYDTVIEQFCAEHRLDFTDGFSEAWNPKLLDEGKDIAIRLFKIHGSITWFETEYKRFIKSIVRIENQTDKTGDDAIELVTGEKAKNLMIYPAQKYEYYEPLFELLMKMKENLGSCDILIVVGYSFRDDHIRQLLWDIARKNKRFNVVLIGPESWSIYNNRLRYYDGSLPIPSSLEKRVVCLPYAFEKFFPFLRDLLKDFNKSNRCYKDCSDKKIMGEVPNWIECLLPAIKSGNHERFSDIFNNEINWNERIFDYNYSPSVQYNQISYFIHCLILNCLQCIAIEDMDLLREALCNLRKYLIDLFDKIEYSAKPALSFDPENQPVKNIVISYKNDFKYLIMHAFNGLYDEKFNSEFKRIGSLIYNREIFEIFEGIILNKIKILFGFWKGNDINSVPKNNIDIEYFIQYFPQNLLLNSDNEFLLYCINTFDDLINKKDFDDKKLEQAFYDAPEKLKQFNIYILMKIFNDTFKTIKLKLCGL